MTKKFEERLSGKASNILSHHANTPMKGEIVTLIPPQISNDDIEEVKSDIKILKKDKSNSSKDITKILSFKYKKISKKDIYDLASK